MSDMRNKGIEYVRRIFGNITPGHITVSQFYDNITKKSWPNCPCWGNHIPVKKLIQNQDVHVICERENGDGFHYLHIPVKEIEGFMKQGDLNITGNKDEEKIALELSAQTDNLFQDLRGNGKINFEKYLQSPPKPE